MKNKLLLFSLVIGIFILAGCSHPQVDTQTKASEKTQSTNQVTTKQVNNSSQYPVSSIDNVADKVQVFLFHTTQRCSTCIAIGKLTGETVGERFPDELNSDRIEFREINIDLPENKELARKFRASGSSLLLNAIKNDIDNIKQDTTVWRLTNNPTAFKDYLEGQLNILLGK